MRNTQLPTGEYISVNDLSLRAFWGDLSEDVQSLTSESLITVAVALGLDVKNHALDSTVGAFAITLAVPDDINVVKVIEMTVDSGDVTMSLANVVGGSAATTCTWNDVGDILVLLSARTKWIVLKEIGVTLSY